MDTNQVRDDEIEIDLMEIFSILIHRIGIIIMTGLIFAFSVMIVTKAFITPQYQSVTKMYVLSKQNSDTLTNADLQTSTLLTKDYAELINSRTVTEAVIADLGLDLDHEEMLQKIEVSTTSDTRIVTIRVVDEDPYIARDIANAVRDKAAEHIKNVMNIEAVNIVDEANVPEEKYSPSTFKNGFIGGMLGCILAVVVILVQYLLNDTIIDTEDVEKYLGLSVLGTIPMDENTGKKKRVNKRKGNKRR